MPSLEELSAWWETVLQKGPASRPGLEQAMGVERPVVGVCGGGRVWTAPSGSGSCDFSCDCPSSHQPI